MVYTRNQPVTTDDLNISQPFLRNNTNAADDSFGIDHYRFSDATVNNGFHNSVTTPGYITTPPAIPVAPPVTIANPVFYGFQPLDAGGAPTTNLGLLQYSRGPNNAAPSIVTMLQSTIAPIVLAPGATTNVLDFTGITKAVAKLYAENIDIAAPRFYEGLIVWNGIQFLSVPNAGANTISGTFAGPVLQVKNTFGAGPTFNQVFWTLQFLRLNL